MIARLILLLLFFQSPAMGQATSSWPERGDLDLNKRVTNYNLGVFGFVGALMRISNDFQIPMGIVWVNSPAARAEVPFAWKDASVRGLIEDIAKTQPGYKVELRNGVVHVFPGFIPDRENFLKMKIGTFLLRDTCVEVASFKLHTLITPIRGNYQISVAGPGDSRVSLELTDSTAENALDALVVASNRKVWIVTFTPESTLTPSGFRRTMSLFTDIPIPDDQQPAWHLRRWEDPLPPAISSERR